MKSQQRQTQPKTVNCREHKEKCTFVCLHKTCSNSFKVGCQKCRKQHGQHPNRLISITDFHKMLCKPIQYLQNSTAFKLMNLKKKIEHIRNFRTSILQKQILLIESNQNIKTTTSAILQQHYRIRDVVSHIDMDTLSEDYDRYLEYLQKCRDFLAYNPVKGNLVFNNQVIKSSRVTLEKHIKTSHELIDSIREFLVKIIEVLLANCAYDEDDDDIEFDNEGQDATSFNIVIKNRTDVTENPNIKNKIEHEAFLQMFDQQKDALNQQINILERQLDFKVNILNKIRSTGSVSKANPAEKNEQEEGSNLSENDHEKISVEEIKSACKGETNSERDTLNQEILELKEEYETMLKNKEDYIQELKDMYKGLQQRLEEKDSLLQQSYSKTINEERLKAQIDDLLKNNSCIQGKMTELEKVIGTLNKKCQEKQYEVFELTNKLSSIRSQSEIKSNEISQNEQLLLQEINQKEQSYINQILRMKQQLEKKDKDISKHKKKYCQLQSLVQKMRQNNANSEQELLQWRKQHELRQRRLREEVQSYHQQLQSLKTQLKNYSEKLKTADKQVQRLNQEVSSKVEFIRQNQKQLQSKELEIKELTNKISAKNKEEQDPVRRSQAQSTIRRHEQENKKIREMKQMLEMSIRKNQELKDKIYQLQTALEDYKYQLKKVTNISKAQSTSERRAFCEQPSNQKVIQASQLSKLQTVNSEFIDCPSASFKKIDSNENINVKGGQKQAYLEIKNIFKAVTEDMKILEQRLKENNVIEKVYLKELERKRNQNKNLKKELENIKLYGISTKSPEVIRSSSPLLKEDKNKVAAKSPFKLQAQESAGGAKKAIKSPK